MEWSCFTFVCKTSTKFGYIEKLISCLLTRCELHADHHGLQTFNLAGRLAIGQLRLNFAEAGVINMFHGGSAVTDGFRFGKSTAGAENAKELRRFTIDLAEHF